MALLACPECGKQVSDRAQACPSCGCPIAGRGPIGAQQASSGPRPVIVVAAPTNRWVYIVLGLFLGCLGIHNFYAGYNGKGATQLIITIVLGWFIVGIVITAIWAIVDICTVRNDAKGNPMI